MTSESALNGRPINGRNAGTSGKSTGRPALKHEQVSSPVRTEGFKIKSYYARSVEEALEKAREEMGPDTILVHSRRTPLESRHLGPYEVVFAQPGSAGRSDQSGADEGGGDSNRLRPGASYGPSVCKPPNNLTARPSEVGEHRLSAEMKQMRRQMDEIMRTMSLRPAPEAEPSTLGTASKMARQILVNAGLDDEISTEIVEAASRSLQDDAKDSCWESPDNGQTENDEGGAVATLRMQQALKSELVSRMPQGPALRERGATASIVAFIGPPGAGKTSALAKLAFRISATRTRPIHLISADTYRIGASDQLRTFASILGASIDFADSPKLVAQAIEASQHAEMILIDTPGLSGSDFELLDDLAEYLGRHAGIEKHLVLPATMRSRDLIRCVQQYEKFNVDRLLFTRLDETDCFGPLYCTAVRSATAVSFLSAGQQIPEDLEEITEKKILELVLGADHNATECAEE